MKNKLAVVVLCFFNYHLFAQSSPTAVFTPPPIADTNSFKKNTPVVTPSSINSVSATPVKSSEEDTHIEYPTVGLGVGVLSFYGDINNNISQSPLNGRIASELTVSQRISDCFLVNFDVLFGKLSADERSTIPSQNANFESEIRSGAVSLVYDFGNFLPKGRNATPFISLGFESFEFLSKTDLTDKNGTAYNYWTDGTIRNIDQNSANADNAVIIKRDYTYESDIRNLNTQKYGKYPERSFAIPLGIGFSYRINNFITFRVSSTMHYTFTDYIDGIVKSNPGRIIPGGNDNFMMSSCGISYNFGYKPKVLVPEFEGFNNQGVDFYKIDNADNDKDGVPDLKDSSQYTPTGVAVDTLGRPLDDDKDWIPNYRDNEKMSPKDAIVNPKGVQLTDSAIADAYNHYIDTTMKYAAVQQMEVFKPAEEDKYGVEIGVYKKSDFMKLPTSIVLDSAITEIKITDTTSRYIIGNYSYLEDAQDRKNQLMKSGTDSAKIMIKQYGTYHYVEPAILNKEYIIQPNKNTTTPSLKINEPIVPDNSNSPKINEEEKPKSLREKIKRMLESK
jgi:hypothetical protein